MGIGRIMNILYTFLKSTNRHNSICFTQCPFCNSRECTLLASKTRNAYLCFKCGVKGDLVGLKRVIALKMSP